MVTSTYGAAGRDFGISELFEATADRVGDRPAIIESGMPPVSYQKLQTRTRQLARYLLDRGLPVGAERAALKGHERGQALMAQYLHNSPEYLEGLLGAYTARVAPFNVNYRYVADELRFLFLDSQPEALQYHACFAPVLAQVLPEVASVKVLLQVNDGSGHPLLPGAVDYEEALASVPPEVGVIPDPDDLYVLYTGGTTGMPRGVLWRQADAVVALLGVYNNRANREWNSLEERLAAIAPRPSRVMPLSPYMHGAAQWGALKALCEGNTVVIPPGAPSFDPEQVWKCAEAEEVTTLSMVGDAFARPLADALERQPAALPALRYLISGGAALSGAQRERLLRAIPQLQIIETIGASETGIQGRAAAAASAGGLTRFSRAPGTEVVSEDMTSFLEPGHRGTGWLASSGRVPLGYLGDAEKTAATFPVVDGRRVSVPGDRARLLSETELEMLGREAMTINTGGEKVFAEEVESVLKSHPDVVDVIVCGRPSSKWGHEVVAIVQTEELVNLDFGEIVDFCATKLARYKLPKALILVDEVRRSPTGKADYRWAADIVSKHDGDAP